MPPLPLLLVLLLLKQIMVIIIILLLFRLFLLLLPSFSRRGICRVAKPFSVGALVFHHFRHLAKLLSFRVSRTAAQAGFIVYQLRNIR